MTRNILFIIASKGFHPVEYGVTRSVLEDAGFKVLVASDKSGEASSENPNLTVSHTYLLRIARPNAAFLLVAVDLRLDEVGAKNFDGIFIIGGPGAWEYLNNLETHRIVQEVNSLPNKIFGAICISPRILADAGVLKNRKITCWNMDKQFQRICNIVGADFVHKEVVIDRNLITANGPSVAKEFGEAIVRAFKE
jgi:protease I